MSVAGAIYSWLCERLYHELAGIYDPVSALVSVGRWDAWRNVALEFVQGPTVLELGFGTGVLLSKLAQPQRAVIGLDRSPAMTALAAKRLATQQMATQQLAQQATRQSTPGPSAPVGGKISVVRGDAQWLPIANRSVDTIISTFPAPYILQERTLRECHRVLKKPDSPRGSDQDETESLSVGRLVIVGLGVWPIGNGIVPRLMRLVPFFYDRSSTQIHPLIVERIEKHGFRLQVEEVCAGDARLGVVLAQPILD